MSFVNLTESAREQRRILSALVVTQIFGTIGVGAAPSIGVLLAGEVTANEALAGLARTASTFGAALCGIPLADLAARFGRRLALATGWAVAALGALLLTIAATASSLLLLIAGLLLMGAGSAAALQARFAAADKAPASQRASALSLIVWVGTIGSVIGPNLGSVGKMLSAHWSLNMYAAAFLVAALSMLLAAFLVYILLRSDCAPGASTSGLPVAPGGSAPKQAAFRTRMKASLAQIKTNSAARYAAITLLMAHIVMVTIMTMTPVHLHHYGASIELIGFTISLHVLGMYGLSPVMGWLADKLGNRRLIIAGSFTLASGAVLCALFAADNALVVIGLTVIGVGWSGVFVPASAMFAGALTADARITAQGGLDALVNLGAALAAFASGLVMAASSFATLAALSLLLLVPAVALRVNHRAR